MSEKFQGNQVICGVFDKELANADDVLAHTAEKFAGTEVICGVFDKELANADDVLAHTAEM